MLEGRQFIEDELMVDRIRVYRADPAAPPPVMDADFHYPPVPDIVIYEGRAHVQVRSDINSNAYEAVIGEHEGTVRTCTIDVPVVADPEQGDIGSTAAILPDDACTILESPMDPERVGRVMNLQAETKDKTFSTRRRLRGLEVVA